ncbi:histidinol-phosphate transaminase [Azotosporobacter soli]|uniref:pyridoxal phosphate-dependent aminotransferase n=1 Tax=Azotosporobacter soli TaxID=3055040 RepID=UPI0031FEDBE2
MNAKYAVKSHLMNYQRASYVSEEETVGTAQGMLDCAYGTNPYGYSDKVAWVREIFSQELNQYPQYPYAEARRHIAAFWKAEADISMEAIRLGCGSMGILSTINKMLVAEKTAVLGYAPQFTEYISEVQCLGGEYAYVRLRRERNFRFDADAFMARMKQRTQLIYIDNPNNPTGQILPLSEIRAIVEKAEGMGCCVIVDEAYGDFMDKSNSAVRLVDAFENLFVVRSFSKGFGLAGMRLGYLVCSKTLMPYYKKVDTPFAVSDLGCRILQSALDDTAFIEDSVNKIRRAKTRLQNGCKKIKAWHTHSSVPILVLEHPDESVDLQRLFLKNNVITEAGKDFIGVGKNAVRLRIPSDIEKLLQVVESIERG